MFCLLDHDDMGLFSVQICFQEMPIRDALVYAPWTPKMQTVPSSNLSAPYLYASSVYVQASDYVISRQPLWQPAYVQDFRSAEVPPFNRVT